MSYELKKLNAEEMGDDGGAPPSSQLPVDTAEKTVAFEPSYTPQRVQTPLTHTVDGITLRRHPPNFAMRFDKKGGGGERALQAPSAPEHRVYPPNGGVVVPDASEVEIPPVPGFGTGFSTTARSLPSRPSPPPTPRLGNPPPKQPDNHNRLKTAPSQLHHWQNNSMDKIYRDRADYDDHLHGHSHRRPKQDTAPNLKEMKMQLKNRKNAQRFWANGFRVH